MVRHTVWNPDGDHVDDDDGRVSVHIKCLSEFFKVRVLLLYFFPILFLKKKTFVREKGERIKQSSV